jgi:hypothetical protein
MSGLAKAMNKKTNGQSTEPSVKKWPIRSRDACQEKNVKPNRVRRGHAGGRFPVYAQ